MIGSGRTEIGHAVLTAGGVAHLFDIDLQNGAAIDRGTIGSGAPLAGLAVGRAHVK